MAQGKEKKQSTVKKIANKLFGGGMAGKAKKEIKKRPNKIEEALRKSGV